MTKLDYLYLANWSLREDLRLILLTLPALTPARAAYQRFPRQRRRRRAWIPQLTTLRTPLSRSSSIAASSDAEATSSFVVDSLRGRSPTASSAVWS
jgi:hypothetical protein